MTDDAPPFGRYRQLRCVDCGDVEREWWAPGADGPFEELDPERHRRPVPDACPICGGPLREEFALVDPSSAGLRDWLDREGGR